MKNQNPFFLFLVPACTFVLVLWPYDESKANPHDQSSPNLPSHSLCQKTLSNPSELSVEDHIESLVALHRSISLRNDHTNPSTRTLGKALIEAKVRTLQRTFSEEIVSALLKAVQERLRTDPKPTTPVAQHNLQRPSHSALEALSLETWKSQSTRRVFFPQLLGTRWVEKNEGFNPHRISADGEYLVSIDYNEDTENDVLTLQSREGTIIKQIQFDDDQVVAAFSPNGEYFAASGLHGPIGLYESATGEKIKELTLTDDQRTRGLVWAPNSKDLAIIMTPNLRISDSTLLIWDVRYPQAKWDLGKAKTSFLAFQTNHTNPELHLFFSNDGHFLVSHDWFQGTAKFWDLRTGSLKRNLFTNCRQCRIYGFSPKTPLLLFKDASKKIKKLHLLSDRLENAKDFPMVRGEVLSRFHFNEKGDRAAAYDRHNEKVIFFSVDKDHFQRLYEYEDQEIYSINQPFYADDSILITKDIRGFIFYFYDTQSGKLVYQLEEGGPHFPLLKDDVDPDSTGHTFAKSLLFVTVNSEGRPYFWSLFHSLLPITEKR